MNAWTEDSSMYEPPMLAEVGVFADLTCGNPDEEITEGALSWYPIEG